MKKLSKILILLLSVALIAGAIAVVASADAGVDNTVELYANDVLVEGVSTYEDALLTVQKGQADGATYTVKLLGNVTTTTAWNTVDAKCYNVETGTVGAGGDNVNRRTTIDLNGYTLDVSGVNDYAFGSQRNYRAVTITGQGKLIVGSKGLLYSMSGAPMKISGTGYGINIVNAEGTTPWNKIAAAGSGCSIVFENCNIDFKYTATGDLTTSHVFNVENSTFKMVNCRMNLDVSKKFTAAAEGNGYVFRFRGTGFAQLTNTSITATTNGIYMDKYTNSQTNEPVMATGQNKTFGEVADNYCLYMENSSLYLDMNQETYDYFRENKATISNLAYSLRTYLIIRNTSATDSNSNVVAPTASIYLKDSYMGANYRLIAGQTTAIDNALTDRTVLTFDHSTLEHINKGFASVGESVTTSGQGFFANITYTNFINKSTVEFNGIGAWNCGGSGNMTSLTGTKYVGAASTGDETGTYFVDLEAGTRLDKNIASGKVDIPTGTSAVQGSDGYYYIVADAEDIVTPPVKSSFTENIGVRGVRMTGIITKDVEIGGVMASYKWALPSTQEQIDNGEVTVNAGNMSITDGKVVVDTANTSYASIGCGMSTSEVSSGNYKVLVSSFDFYANGGEEGSLPIEMIYAGNRGGGTNYIKTLNFNADGTVTGTNAKAGQWNTVSMVVDLGAKMLYVYVNGEHVATQAEPNLTQLQDFRLQWDNTVAVNAGAWIALDNGVCLKYADYFSGEFDPAKYLNGYKDISGKIFVGNTEYAEIDVALAATKTETGFSGFVTIAGDLANTCVVNEPGYIFAGSNSVELVPGTDTIKIHDLGNGGYYAERLANYTTNFVVGETTYTAYTLQGNTTAIPEGILTPNIDDGTTVYDFLGWTVTNIAYADKTAEEYNAAVAEAEVLSTDDIAALTPEGDVTYYAVYTANKIAFSILYSGNTVKYSAETNMILELEKRTCNGGTATVTLYEDYTIDTPYDDKRGMITPDSEAYLRGGIVFELNNKTLTFDYDKMGGNTGFQLARGNITFQNGNVVQTFTGEDPTKVGIIVNVHMGGAYLKVQNVTFTGHFLASITSANNGDYYCQFEDSTFISAENSVKPIVQNQRYAGETDSLRVTDCVFYTDNNVVADWWENGSTGTFTRCTFVTSDGKSQMFTAPGEETSTDKYVFVDCKIFGVINGNAYFAGTTVSYGKTSYGEIYAQDSENYGVIYTTPTTVNYEGKDYTVNLAVAPIGSIRTTTFYDLDGETVLAKVKHLQTVVATTLVNVTPTASIPVNAAMQYVWNGEWTKGVNSFTATKVLTYTEEFANGGAMVNLALTDGFDVYIYVAADYLEFYDQATKALLSEETMEIGGKQYYYLKAASLNANQGYTNASFTVVLTDGTNTVDVQYDVTVAAYLEAALALTEGDDQQLCYYIAKYLNDAYSYFATTDADKATTVTFADLVVKYITLNSSVSRPEVNTDYAGFVGTGTISVDLTSNPTFVINSTAAGTVTFAGETYELVAGEELRVSSLANRFDEVVTIVIGENTYTYCLGNYVANVEADEASSAELKNLVASFYNYILFASKF